MKREKINLKNFAEVNTKSCEGKCEREVIPTKDGPVIICHGCNRIVIDCRPV